MKAGDNYDPDSYGVQFELVEPGVYRFEIYRCKEKSGKNGNYLELTLNFLDEKYIDQRSLKAFLNEGGAIQALFDAAGRDPSAVEYGKDYEPSSFEGKQVWAEIYHKKAKNKKGEERTYANIKRLYPYFSKGGIGGYKPEEPISEPGNDDVPW